MIIESQNEMNIPIIAISFADLRFHVNLKNKFDIHEMSMIAKSLTV